MVVDLRDSQVEPADFPGNDPQITYQDEVFYCYRNRIKPPCECQECSQQYRTYENQWSKKFTYRAGLSDEEAESMASAFVREIMQNIRSLQEQCSLSGGAIMKRWTKMNNAKRAKMLTEVDPSIYPHQWVHARLMFEFSVFVERTAFHDRNEKIDKSPGMLHRALRSACLLPYINVEALSTGPARLLNLLYNRTNYSPAQWAPYDNASLSLDWRRGSFETMYNSNCIVMRGDRYGELTPSEKDDAHSWDVVGFPRAILVLEMQQRITKFLLAMVNKVLEGYATPERRNTAVTAGLTLRPSLKSSRGVEFASRYLNQPFCAPSKFDLDEILSIATASYNLHNDHLELLQTEPAYCRYYVALGRAGGLGAYLKSEANRNAFAALRLMEDVSSCLFWKWILEEVQEVHRISPRVANPGTYGGTVDAVYSKALSTLELFLTNQMDVLEKHIRDIYVDRPGLRKNFCVRYVEHLQTVEIESGRPEGNASFVPGLFFEDRLDYCLWHLVEEDPARRLARDLPDIFENIPAENMPLRSNQAHLFAMLDEHLSHCTKNKKTDELARFDEILYSMYSDLSSLYQILSMIRLHQPRIPKGDFESAKKSAHGRGWRYIRNHFQEQDHRRTVIVRIEEAEPIPMQENEAAKIAAEQHLGRLMASFLATKPPSGSRFSQVWLDKDDAQRAALADFWDGMRNRHQSTLVRLGFGSEDIDSDNLDLSKGGNPLHVAKIDAIRQEILAKLAGRAARETDGQSVRGIGAHAVQTQWGSNSDEVKSETETHKTKLKTRSMNSQVEQEQPQAKEAEPEEDEVKTASVSKAATGVFRALFSSGNFEDRTKSVSWTSFVQAMEEVGFVAQHCGGSAVHFEPNGGSQWCGMGSICFHRPHPDPVLGPIMLHGMAKRLNKWFGWTEGSFVVKQK